MYTKLYYYLILFIRQLIITQVKCIINNFLYYAPAVPVLPPANINIYRSSTNNSDFVNDPLYYSTKLIISF